MSRELGFTTADVVSFINNLPANERAQYFGNPNTNFKGKVNGEAFAFINFFADPNNQPITFDKKALHQAGGGLFESDNHTIAASYTSITGMEIAPEPIDPVPGDIVEVESGGTLVSDTPAEIGSGSEVIVDMGGQIKESAPIVIESGGVIVDNGTITDGAPVEIHIGGELLGEGTIDAHR